MAYTLVPDSPDYLSGELRDLYTFIQEETGVSDPIAVNVESQDQVKVLRDLSDYFNIIELRRKFKGLRLKWGNGSRGGGGLNNQGHLFERELFRDLEEFCATRSPDGLKHEEFIRALDTTYSLSSSAFLSVTPDGEANNKRPLIFSPSPLVGGPATDVGTTISDLTVHTDDRDVYLSLKSGKTVTLFNSGIARVVPPREVAAGLVQNEAGLELFSVFGIDNEEFCRVFNSYAVQARESRVVETQFDKKKLHEFLKSGVGYGYHYVHRITGTVVHHEVTRQFCEELTEPLSCVIKYPGSAKHVTARVATPYFNIEVKFRNKNGGLWPTALLAQQSR